MGLKLALVVVVLNVGLSLCKTIEPEPVQLFTRPDSSKIVARFVASKLVRRLESATNNQEVYDTLLRSDGHQEIQGKSTAASYSNMAYLSVQMCQVDHVAKRKATCDAAKIPSLQTYCKYCLEKLTEYCNANKDWIAQNFLHLVRDRRLVGHVFGDVSAISKGIDRYISILDEKTDSEEKSVKGYCERTKDLKRKISDCDYFLNGITELFKYQSDRKRLFEIIAEQTGHKLESPLRRCKIMKKECTGIRSG